MRIKQKALNQRSRNLIREIIMADFSIVTVTYNSEKTIRKAMESVINQTMPPKEYFIIDGLSSDDTVDIANSYKDLALAKGINLIVISEKDNGMYDAMNKGISMASGDVVGMINSDDFYELCAIEEVNKLYEKEKFDLFWSDINMILPDGKSFVKQARNRDYMTSRDWNHPTTFITKEMYKKYSYRNETIHDDYDLILRMKKDGVKVSVLNKPLANFTMNGISHKRSVKGAMERARIKYEIYRRNGYSWFYIVECIGVEVAKLIIG